MAQRQTQTLAVGRRSGHYCQRDEARDIGRVGGGDEPWVVPEDG